MGSALLSNSARREPRAVLAARNSLRRKAARARLLPNPQQLAVKIHDHNLMVDGAWHAKTKSTQQSRHPAKRSFPLFFGYLLNNPLVRL